MLTVSLVPHIARPGVGRAPKRETRRTWMPQHAHLCPAIDDGNALGYLVYPPLHDTEGYQLSYQSDHSFRFSFFSSTAGIAPELRFVLTTTPARGNGGMMSDELTYLDPNYGFTSETARALRDALVVNLNTPPGGAGLRGSVDFQTPADWDTIYTEVLNQPEPPRIPVLTARIQTDWFAQDTEFRYLLQPGQSVSFAGFTPVGQVFFVPRDDATLIEAAPDAITAFRERQEQYWSDKAADQSVTGYGCRYSTLYRRTARQQMHDER